MFNLHTHFWDNTTICGEVQWLVKWRVNLCDIAFQMYDLYYRIMGFIAHPNQL